VQRKDFHLPEELQEEVQKATVALKQVEEVKEEEEEKIELQFEDADLQNFVQQIAEVFHITFISDENIDPLPQGTGSVKPVAIKGNKITFKTNKPLSRREAWDLFVTFLDIAGFAVVPQPDPTIYRIQVIKSAQRAPIPTYIGVNYETLPDNDQLIRYLYFIENATIESMQAVIKDLGSTSSGSPIFLKSHEAFILTDKSYNIKSLMQIVKELDKVTMPQAMTVLKLHQVDAGEVKKLYDELTQQGADSKSTFRPFGARKQPTSIYFPENARIITEPRTNSLILLGPKDAIAKIEEFIVKHIDVDLDQPYSPLHTYQLEYADAKAIADIMNNTTKFGNNTEAGKSGGVRGTDKYLRQMQFTPEPGTNKLIVKGDYEDFLLVKKILDELDKPQPQVALEVLVLSITLQDAKQLGTQLRSKFNAVPALKDFLGKDTVFQTSGLAAGGLPQGIVTNPNGAGVDRLLGNLLNLVTNAPAGNTIVTFGSDMFGVWGLFQVLRTITSTEVISNPFLVASNQNPARVALGTTRRIIASQVYTNNQQPTTSGLEDMPAELVVDISPQINSDGMIVLTVQVSNTEFTSSDQTNGNTLRRLIKTQAILADREVLALGGFIREENDATQNKTPILGDIPILGWLFKNQSKTVSKSSILVLISTKIIPPFDTKEMANVTKERISEYNLAFDADVNAGSKDPISKIFFKSNEKEESISNLLFDRHNQPREKRGRKGKKKSKKETQPNPQELKREEEQVKNLKVVQNPPVALKEQALQVAQQNEIAKMNKKLQDKKRSSQSLSSFLSPTDKGTSV
jgi:general secretion pathway protein D